MLGLVPGAIGCMVLMMLVGVPPRRFTISRTPALVWNATSIGQMPATQASTTDGLVRGAMPIMVSCGVPAWSIIHKCPLLPWKATTNPKSVSAPAGPAASTAAASPAVAVAASIRHQRR
jgi:hypothetical protein